MNNDVTLELWLNNEWDCTRFGHRNWAEWELVNVEI